MYLLPLILFLSAEFSITYADALDLVDSNKIAIKGYVGNRIERNLSGILLHKDEAAMLDGFRHRKVGGPPWIGEHVGKWLSAASLAYQYSGNEELGAKIKRVAHGLIDTQLDNGYLGTYGPPERWKRWDVWVHKYNLLGLQAYYDATKDQRGLEACRKMADLIIRQFGPGEKDILKAGTHGGVAVHQGMAATSILEPFVELYVRTGERKYLTFCRYIVDSLERDHGPHIVSTLRKKRSVQRVANAKAYEMISNILGLLKMYRLEGNKEFLEAAEIAFEDIVKRRSYITGGSTFGETFQEEGYFPNPGHVAEMCVMMSQLQLARELLLLTGEVKYGNAMEHLILNHLLAGQHSSGESICYYTPLWGRKFYMTQLACCISSGPRAIALIPSLYYLKGEGALVVNLFGASEVSTELGNRETAQVTQKTDFPLSDRVNIEARAAKGIGYKLLMRISPTAVEPTMKVNGRPFTGVIKPGEWVEVKVDRDKVNIDLDLGFRWQIIQGTGTNEGLFALRHGPTFFAFDHGHNHEIPRSVFGAFDMDLGKLAPKLQHTNGRWIAQVNGYAPKETGELTPCSFRLLPFTDAGEKDFFSLWLRDRARGDKKNISLFTQVHEHVSRRGNLRGSFTDNSSETFTTTHTGDHREKDYFEVDAGWSCEFNVVVFRHGRAFPGGGWFDTSHGRPEVELKIWRNYKKVAVLEDYPPTTAEDPGSLTDGQAFRVVIPKDQREAASGVRVIGVPAHGNDPHQNFASCSEIQVYFDPDL